EILHKPYIKGKSGDIWDKSTPPPTSPGAPRQWLAPSSHRCSAGRLDTPEDRPEIVSGRLFDASGLKKHARCDLRRCERLLSLAHGLQGVTKDRPALEP